MARAGLHNQPSGLAEQAGSPAIVAQIQEIREELQQCEGDESTTNERLETFDTLDFDVFSNQAWDRLRESHAEDIVVHWPDGRETQGLQRHIEDMKAMFVYAPDTQIKQHPVRFGRGEFTCVTGIMTGTFTRPMPAGDGKVIPPTGKAFSLVMCTVGRWKDGVMVEEWLFWDNATYMKQIGVSP